MTQPFITSEFSALQFNRPWQLLLPHDRDDPQTSIRLDEELLHQVGRGEIGPSICIRQDPQSLVVTRREARMQNFAQASQTLAAHGWPVAVRCSGGSCVPQGPGVINLSIIHPHCKTWSLKDGYQLLDRLLKGFLASCGLQATTGEVSGAFCDGRYNLQVDGRKIVGTAQRWAGAYRSQAAVLSHACLLVDLDLAEATHRINQLYQLCNNPQSFNPQACITLRDALPHSSRTTRQFVTGIKELLAKQIRQAFAI